MIFQVFHLAQVFDLKDVAFFLAFCIFIFFVCAFIFFTVSSNFFDLFLINKWDLPFTAKLGLTKIVIAWNKWRFFDTNIEFNIENNIFVNDNKDGFEYEGSFRKGNKHGYGVYKWTDGSKFQGQWEKLDPSC